MSAILFPGLLSIESADATWSCTYSEVQQVLSSIPAFLLEHRQTAQDAQMLFLLLQLVEGAEAKALYGLTLNYKPLEALVTRLLRDSTLSGEQVAEVLNGAGLVPFPDPFVEGFQWDENGRLVYPGIEDEVRVQGLAC